MPLREGLFAVIFKPQNAYNGRYSWPAGNGWYFNAMPDTRATTLANAQREERRCQSLGWRTQIVRAG